LKYVSKSIEKEKYVCAWYASNLSKLKEISNIETRVILVHPLLGSPVSTICEIIKYGVWECFSTSASFQSSGLFTVVCFSQPFHTTLIQSFFTTYIRLVVFLHKTKHELFVILILHDW